MSKIKGYSVLAFLFVFMVLIIACAEKDEPSNDPNNDLNNHALESLLQNSIQEGRFIFDGIEWKTSKAEIVERIGKGSYSFDMPSTNDDKMIESNMALSIANDMIATIVYIFEGDELVSGEVWYRTKSDSTYGKIANEIHDAIEATMDDLQSQPIALLKSMEDNGSTVLHWTMTDRSRLNITRMSNGEKVVILKFSMPK